MKKKKKKKKRNQQGVGPEEIEWEGRDFATVTEGVVGNLKVFLYYFSPFLSSPFKLYTTALAVSFSCSIFVHYTHHSLTSWMPLT